MSADAASLAGAVVDPDGRPVPRARVVLEGPVGIVASTLTQDDGRYSLDPMATGSYVVRVLADGFRSAPQTVSVTGSEAATVNFSLELSAVSETLVVSASQIEAPRSSAPAAVTVITSAELKAQQIETLADAFRGVPGQTIVRSGGRGALTSLFPRGGESDYTLVAADGVRLNSFGGGFDFSNLAVEGVERVEIVRGPQSALFGADAIGGVVQIVNRRGAPLRASALVEGGGFGTVRAAAAASGGTSQWSWGAAVDRPQSDGFRGAAANGEAVTNDDWEAWTTTFNLGVDAPKWNARGHGQFSDSDRGNPGPYGSDPNGTFFGVDRVARSIIGINAGDVAASWLAGEGFRLRGAGVVCRHGRSLSRLVWRVLQRQQPNDRSRRRRHRVRHGLERHRRGRRRSPRAAAARTSSACRGRRFRSSGISSASSARRASSRRAACW